MKNLTLPVSGWKSLGLRGIFDEPVWSEKMGKVGQKSVSEWFCRVRFEGAVRGFCKGYSMLRVWWRGGVAGGWCPAALRAQKCICFPQQFWIWPNPTIVRYSKPSLSWRKLSGKAVASDFSPSLSAKIEKCQQNNRKNKVREKNRVLNILADVHSEIKI